MLLRNQIERPVFLAIALAVAACSDPAGPEGGGAVQVRAFSRGFAPVSSQSGDVRSVEIERVYLVLGRVKLEKAADGTADFTDERSIVIRLGSGADPVLAVSTDVPAGAYKEVELAIDKLERGQPSEKLLIDAYPGLSEASLLVEGTLTRNGGGPQGFAFAAALDIDLEVAFSPPLAIEAPQPGLVLLSLVLDASGWFRSPSGMLLDPTEATNRSVIESAIQQSIELFEDSNRDGAR